VPPIFTATLLVTVFVVDEDTAVDDRMLPDTVGSVSVGVPAMAVACRVTVPEVSPVINIPLMLSLNNEVDAHVWR